LGEAASAPLEILDEKRQKLHEIIKEYDLNNVFNCNETGHIAPRCPKRNNIRRNNRMNNENYNQS
jgi:predicted aldo/keto reductase-like oxidoreductase